MADPRTLLQRLVDPPSVRVEGRDAECRALADSVRRNLADLFGTRQGSCAADPGYGMPDVAALLGDLEHPPADVSQDGVRRLADRVARAVTRHEPRLRLSGVRPVPDPDDPFGLRFEIDGQLVHEGRLVGPFRLVAALRDQRLVIP